MSTKYSYGAVLEAAEKAEWRIDDIIGGDRRLDFRVPFLPESLARVETLTFLSGIERLTLNHIRAVGYLRMFGLVEEFILPFVMGHAKSQPSDDLERMRALLTFASEEAKHIQLFRTFEKEFERGFGSPCGFIGPAEAVAAHVLSHDPLAVALVILHIEWMTQRHYTESVAGEADLDPLFKSLLRHHWMEEAQHAKLDTLMVESIAADRDAEGITRGISEYLAIGGYLDDGLRTQARLDAESLQVSTGRVLRDHERADLERAQHQALRWTFLGSGMTHPKFLGTVEGIRPSARRQIEGVSPVFA